MHVEKALELLVAILVPEEIMGRIARISIEKLDKNT
jgi:hypothetical protein